MSGLAYICGYGYGSNSDESDCEYVPKNIKREKLPAPDLSKVSTVPKDDHVDDPTLHEGRSRSFPHVRGNWATFVFIKYPEEDIVKLVQKLQLLAASVDETCQLCDDFHVSLTKTLVLTFHLITPFTSSLQTSLGSVKSFSLGFDSVKVYCNEEKSRTFIALKADHSSSKHLLELTTKVDKILLEYKLPTFYEDASFHMSILWVNGDKQKELTNILQSMHDIVAQEIGKSLNDILINQIHCKSGNKYFSYSLE